MVKGGPELWWNLPTLAAHTGLATASVNGALEDPASGGLVEVRYTSEQQKTPVDHRGFYMGPEPRKFYKVTPKGIARLRQMQADVVAWRAALLS